VTDLPQTKVVEELLEQARDRRQTALSEHDSKKILAAYGIPVVEERLVADAARAAHAAKELGYPVAVKACGPALAHKSDRGLVRLNLPDAAAVAEAVPDLADTLGETPFDGFLVQRMARGKRELIIGGLRDPMFGPCVMAGAGGIAVEAIGDVAFRLAPLEERDALEMLGELGAARILGEFRGESAIDRRTLARIIVQIGHLLANHPQITQLDINPLILEDAAPVAVDALIMLSPSSSLPEEIPAEKLSGDDREALFKALFEPESVAIVGVSESPLKWGFRILYNTLEGGYKGRLYGVNPKYQELMGIRCYPSVSALPEPVDLVLIVVPPSAVAAELQECIQKGVKAVLVITAGFGETDDPEAQAAQQHLVEMARAAGILVVGPNCAGVASPAPHHLYCGMISRFPSAGGLSIVSQSGNVGTTVLTWAGLHQVGVARFITSGNEAATHTEDYLDFYAQDPRTQSILAYVEGTRKGRRLFESLHRAAARKPLVLIKGGRSHAGLKAAQSHTGALAGEIRLFRAACRQAGVIVVDDVYEAMEVGAVFLNQPLPKGRRVVIVCQGGGWGVIGADACAEAGLDVMPLPEDTLRELDGFLPPWWSRNNPIDLVAGNDLSVLPRAIDTVIKSPGVDAVILLGIGYIASSKARFQKSETAARVGLDKLSTRGAEMELDHVRQIAESMRTHQKPLLIASDTVLTAYGAIPNEVIKELERLDIYIFSSPTHVARALAHLAERYEYLHGRPRRSGAARRQ